LSLKRKSTKISRSNIYLVIQGTKPKSLKKNPDIARDSFLF
jgi:hypothetical protein